MRTFNTDNNNVPTKGALNIQPITDQNVFVKMNIDNQVLAT